MPDKRKVSSSSLLKSKNFKMKYSLNTILLNYRNYLKKLFPQTFIYILNKELFLKIPFKKLKNIVYFLNNHSQSQFKVLSDICALDFP
jgi:hypothetical protein